MPCVGGRISILTKVFNLEIVVIVQPRHHGCQINGLYQKEEDDLHYTKVNRTLAVDY